MTSDRAPEELSELEGRLEERFRSGLVVEMAAPGFNVRRANEKDLASILERAYKGF